MLSALIVKLQSAIMLMIVRLGNRDIVRSHCFCGGDSTRCTFGVEAEIELTGQIIAGGDTVCRGPVRVSVAGHL